MVKMQKAKVGVILDEFFVPDYISKLLMDAEQSKIYEIDCFIIQKETSSSGNSLFKKTFSQLKLFGVKQFIEKFSFWFLYNVELFLLSKLSNTPAKRIDGEEDIKKPFCIDVKPIKSKNGLVYRYAETDLKLISDRNLDLLIRGGSGILKGDVLSAAKRGILSFHHGDNDWNRGGPAGFWEVFQKKSTTGFVLQLLTEELDGGKIIFKGNCNTAPLYTLNRAKLFAKASAFLHLTIEKFLKDPNCVGIYPEVPYCNELHKTPTLIVQFKYLVGSIFFIFAKVLDKINPKKIKWSVAYQYCDDWRSTVLHKSKIIKNPPGRFFADPFLYRVNGKSYCFLEDYEFSKKKGRISVLELTPEGDRYIGVAIEETFHLSYPFVFESEGDLFMCPESHENRDIRLYKCVDFPLKWELTKVLMSDIDAADTSLLKNNGEWWLLTNVCTATIGDHNSELHMFSSKDLLSDHWIPHKKNPVIFDAKKARNGGLLSDGNHFYRVFQKHGWNRYGESCGVSKIVELSEDAYIEEELFTLRPNFMEGVKGIHSYSQTDGVVAFDFLTVK
ncbi:hypothetical protein N9X39_03730 [Alphaproteobacteria bacterium]|nr:hypothetical protein [Alphaproteobacteria bacterium]